LLICWAIALSHTAKSISPVATIMMSCSAPYVFSSCIYMVSSRHVYNSKQEVQNSPWRIQIVNGKGIKKQNRNGGSYMQAKSFVSEKTAFIQLTDMDLYTLLKRVDSYITNWEAAYAPTLIINGKQMLNQQRQAQQPAAAPYNQGQYAEPNFYVA